MGVWDRIRGVGEGGYREKAARKLEREGSLAAAVEAYLEAELPDEAARVLLVRADAEGDLAKRLAFLEEAGRVAGESAQGKLARGRRAKLSFELLRGRAGLARTELLHAAEELSAAGEHLVAAEAYALVGDDEGEVRALTAAGAIDRLEAKLAAEAASSRDELGRSKARREVEDLDRVYERRAALAAGAAVNDETVTDLCRVIRQRLARGPSVQLTFDGETHAVALGEALTVGRGEASIVVGSRALSRVHLNLRRDAAGAAIAEDAGTRNGTFLRGARIAGPIPVGEGISLKLGGEIVCDVHPHPSGGVLVDVAGQRFLAPLGPLRVAGLALGLEGRGGDEASFVVLESSAEVRAFAGTLELARRVELCHGDAIAVERGGEPVLRVGSRMEAT